MLCKKRNNATKIANLLFKEIVRLNGFLIEIMSYRYTMFISNFLRTLQKKFNTKLDFNLEYQPQNDGQIEMVNISCRNY